MNKILLAALLITGLSAQAQEQPAKKQPAVKPVAKFKPPVVKTFLAKFSGASAVCSVEEGKQIITLPLRIADDKNTSYTLSSYQFAYKRLGVKENEETGELTPASDMVAERFTTSPLPEIWKTNIIETLKKGEELFFFDVIVKDKQGRLFFAPDLKISIR